MRLLTAAETRMVLRIDQKTLMKIIKSGALPALRIGTAKAAPIRISSKALAEYTGTPERSDRRARSAPRDARMRPQAARPRASTCRDLDEVPRGGAAPTRRDDEPLTQDQADLVAAIRPPHQDGRTAA